MSSFHFMLPIPATHVFSPQPPSLSVPPVLPLLSALSGWGMFSTGPSKPFADPYCIAQRWKLTSFMAVEKHALSGSPVLTRSLFAPLFSYTIHIPFPFLKKKKKECSVHMHLLGGMNLHPTQCFVQSSNSVTSQMACELCVSLSIFSSIS